MSKGGFSRGPGREGRIRQSRFAHSIIHLFLQAMATDCLLCFQAIFCESPAFILRIFLYEAEGRGDGVNEPGDVAGFFINFRGNLFILLFLLPLADILRQIMGWIFNNIRIFTALIQMIQKVN